MIDDEWARGGSNDAQAGESTIPTFIEIGPDLFKRVDDCCSAGELRANADGLMLQAKALMDDARNLYELADRKE